jgi:hypothetical protein
MNEISKSDRTIGFIKIVTVVVLAVTALACIDIADKQRALSSVVERVSR